ncbi:MAG TPA: pitrilysin family protein [Candidatus Saccharimonadia bacterium]|nr:pitrilysin family protein [Candidatus Saccharimonadia bacterium]
MKTFRDVRFQKQTLKSGLTVILVPVKGVESATVLVYVGTGSRYEPSKWAGISHFLEHMVFKGTKKYPTPMALSAAIDAVGAEFNAFTSKDVTAYYVKAASNNVDLALDVVSDMLLTPKLLTADLEREKGVIVEEMHMYLDMPSRNIGNIFEELMYAGSNLGPDVIGTEKTVRALKREDFAEYIRQWYGQGNVVVTIAGDAEVVNAPDLVKRIEKYFSKQGEVSKRENGGTRNFNGAPRFGLSLLERVRVDYKKTDQAHFIMAMPGLKRGHKDRFAANVLSALFGGYMSSRLFTEVREKRGLCYYVRSDLDSYHETGLFGASAGVDPARVEEAIKVVRQELEHLIDTTGPRKITQAEITRAKDHIIGKIMLSLEDTENIANMYGSHQVLLGEIESVKDMLEGINAVTLADVRRVAKDLVKIKELRFAMIGPFKDKKVFEKLLKA